VVHNPSSGSNHAQATTVRYQGIATLVADSLKKSPVSQRVDAETNPHQFPPNYPTIGGRESGTNSSTTASPSRSATACTAAGVAPVGIDQAAVTGLDDPG